jgi:hypothetical protein
MGWLGILPADGSNRGRSVGPHVENGDQKNMQQAWSPDGATVILRFSPLEYYRIDPKTGDYATIDWPVDELPDWRRLAFD